MSDQPLIARSTSIAISMFAFFLIFATVAGIVELVSEGPDGEQSYALFSASAATIIYGLIASWVGTRLPARWWGEAILVALIFYPIWLLMNAVSGSLDAEAVWSGLLYAAIAAVIGVVFFLVFARADDSGR